MKNNADDHQVKNATESAKRMDAIRFILGSKEFGAEALMQDFAARYHPLLASSLLHQLHLYATEEVDRPLENKADLDEFYEDMYELLVAVYSFCAKINSEQQVPGQASAND